jgi:hypothetical protein
MAEVIGPAKAGEVVEVGADPSARHRLRTLPG